MISIRLAAKVLLFLFGFLVIFHLLILAGKIPYDIVWAGKIKNREELIKMESISLFVLLLSVIIVSLKAKYLKIRLNQKVINIGAWLLFAFFTLNTLGNLTAESPIEKYGFGLLTAGMSFLAWRLAVGDSRIKKNKNA